MLSVRFRPFGLQTPLKKNEGFKRLYELAKQIQVYDLMDEILDISDNLDAFAKRYRRRPINEDLIYLVRIKIDEIKWKTIHLMPRKYKCIGV